MTTRKAPGKAAPAAGKVAAKSGKDPVKQAAGRKGRAAVKGRNGGGRKPGTPNKRTVELREALQRAGLSDDTHPVVMMYRVYTGEITMPVVVQVRDGDEVHNEIEDVPLEPALRVRCMAEVAQYLEPKRKSIEGVAGGEPIAVTLVDSRTLPGWAASAQNPKNKG